MPQYDLLGPVDFGQAMGGENFDTPKPLDEQPDIVKNSPNQDGKYPEGETVELTEEQAAPLLEARQAVPSGQEAPVGLAHDNPEELGYEGEAERQEAEDAPDSEERAPKDEAPKATAKASGKASGQAQNKS